MTQADKETLLNPFSEKAILTQKEAGEYLTHLVQWKHFGELEKEAYELSQYTQKRSKVRLFSLISDWQRDKEGMWKLRGVVSFQLAS